MSQSLTDVTVGHLSMSHLTSHASMSQLVTHRRHSWCLSIQVGRCSRTDSVRFCSPRADTDLMHIHRCLQILRKQGWIMSHRQIQVTNHVARVVTRDLHRFSKYLNTQHHIINIYTRRWVTSHNFNYAIHGIVCDVSRFIRTSSQYREDHSRWDKVQVKRRLTDRRLPESTVNEKESWFLGSITFLKNMIAYYSVATLVVY